MLAVVGATLALATLVVGCSTGETVANGNSKTVAFGHPASSSSIYPLLVQGAQEEADRRGYDLLTSSANMDAGAQVDELNTWISQRIAGVIVAPVDTAGMAPIVQKAKTNDVRFLAYAAKSVPGADGSVIFANREGGELVGAAAGEWVNAQLGGRAKVALLTDYDQETGKDRIDGAVEALRAAAPDIEVVATQEGLFADETLPIFQSMLQAHPDINVVFCMADDGCVGAEKAFLQTNPSEERKRLMYMAGWDGTLPVLEQIATGSSVIRATAVLDLVAIGRASIAATVDAVEGGGDTEVVIPYELVGESNPQRAQEFVNTYDAILAAR
ncbi:sugar ABC transporter substrate-binding protein [Pseudonocardia hierapolitana]|uniref:sugar ABC transporter substrate-binding protein n=1 Tax=Pseudonocardia hierapolitana TaxID=1128676 RepID=UPI0014792E8C|nr:sugar ABC transporter substrate-binding protein [Pseudonocardia hierapolitana]